MTRDFSHVDVWIFDLDNTLYPPRVRLFDQIEVKMTAFVMEALGVDHNRANHLRTYYWEKYGTTLAGLMDEHGVDPGPYLTDVHDISFDALEPDPELADKITSLPGRKLIYTNGTASYAEKVSSARGLSGVFDGIYGVEHANFRPKPERQAFDAIAALDGFDPKTAAMFEDDVRNLSAPKNMGMKTIHVAPDPTDHDFVDHHTDDLPRFLATL